MLAVGAKTTSQEAGHSKVSFTIDRYGALCWKSCSRYYARFMHTELRKTTNSLANLTGEKEIEHLFYSCKVWYSETTSVHFRKVTLATDAVSSVKNAVILSFKFS